MSTLVLVRHGQANFFSDDYDRLSAVGEAQARCLGEFWTSRGLAFDEVYTGTLRRQMRTAELVGEVYAQAGLPWPELVALTELNEYDSDGIVKELLPVLVERDERIKQLAENYQRSDPGPERYKHFQRMFEAVMTEWVQGSIVVSGVESWRSFHDRVRRALQQITEGEAGGRRIAVFSSGGPISIAVQLAMRAPESMALQLNWRIRNCSLSEIVFTRGRFTLDSFNAIPHLDDPGLWTYR